MVAAKPSARALAVGAQSRCASGLAARRLLRKLAGAGCSAALATSMRASRAHRPSCARAARMGAAMQNRKAATAAAHAPCHSGNPRAPPPWRRTPEARAAERCSRCGSWCPSPLIAHDQGYRWGRDGRPSATASCPAAANRTCRLEMLGPTMPSGCRAWRDLKRESRQCAAWTMSACGVKDMHPVEGGGTRPRATGSAS